MAHTDLFLRCKDADFEKVVLIALDAGMNVDTTTLPSAEFPDYENQIKVYGEHTGPLRPLFEGLDVQVEAETTVDS